MLNKKSIKKKASSVKKKASPKTKLVKKKVAKVAKVEKDNSLAKTSTSLKSLGVAKGGLKFKPMRLPSKKELATKTLVIVESPAKAKTINRYLGNSFIIEASLGHIIDLPKSRIAIDVKDDFKPEYITVRGRAKVLNRLKKMATSVEGILLAADLDREGEAISWHLKNALLPKNPNIKRIDFNEITKPALQAAIKNPREIKEPLVNAQQARRILDRLVGYTISPILWKKIKNGLSAGRVQSVALKYICEREKQIDDFIEAEYWSLSVNLALAKSKKSILKADLYSIAGERQDKQITSEEQMNKLIAVLKDKPFIVSSIAVRERQREATPAYTTSKLQQDASTRLGFSSLKTMMVAQQLYEGIDLGKRGFTGLISYMRTDSNRSSPEAISVLREFIKKEYGPDYVPEKPRSYKNKRGAQDAHEAIRPTNPNLSPDKIGSALTKEQLKLYQMIWQKFVSSQMTNEVSIYTTIELSVDDKNFRAVHRRIKFDGFTLVFDKAESKEKQNDFITKLNKDDELSANKFEPQQHFTKPPPRYSDALMVKVLEEIGIGRPSTYAPTIQTLLKRYYACRIGRNLKPTELGLLVNRIMKQHFPKLVDAVFTAKMEEELDMVASSDKNWVDMLSSFYKPFEITLKEAAENIEDLKASLDKPTEYICEKCGTNMVKRLGRNGYFLACPRFPDCRNAKSIPLGPCVECDEGSTVKRATKKGRAFFGCNRYPDCDFSTWDVPSEEICPECNKLLFEKNSRNRKKELVCLKCEYKKDVSLSESNAGSSAIDQSA